MVVGRVDSLMACCGSWSGVGIEFLALSGGGASQLDGLWTPPTHCLFEYALLSDSQGRCHPRGSCLLRLAAFFVYHSLACLSFSNILFANRYFIVDR